MFFFFFSTHIADDLHQEINVTGRLSQASSPQDTQHMTNGMCCTLRTFVLIVCVQRCCAGNATVICHTSLHVLATIGPEDKHGVENARGKNCIDFTPLDHL